MRHSLFTLAVVAAALVPGALRAQATNQLNDAILVGTVDPAALGIKPQPVFGLYVSGHDDYLSSLGFGAGVGALRLISSVDQWLRTSFGAGYALGIAHDIPHVGTVTAGTDAEIGYTSSVVAKSNWAIGTRLALPIGIRWGSIGRVSVAPYLIPYVELGSQARFEGAPAGCADIPGQYSCTDFRSVGQRPTNAAGLGYGLHVTVGRLTLEGAYRDTQYPGRQLHGATVGASLSFPQP